MGSCMSVCLGTRQHALPGVIAVNFTATVRIEVILGTLLQQRERILEGFV
jgi:hypothetical protein